MPKINKLKIDKDYYNQYRAVLINQILKDGKELNEFHIYFAGNTPSAKILIFLFSKLYSKTFFIPYDYYNDVLHFIENLENQNILTTLWEDDSYFKITDFDQAKLYDEFFKYVEYYLVCRVLNKKPKIWGTESRNTRIIFKENKKCKQGYVYLIKSEYGYKIGKSRAKKSRYNIFSVKLPFEIELVRSVLVDDYNIVETLLHNCFKDIRMNGEWFNLENIDSHLTVGQLFDKELNKIINEISLRQKA